MSRPSCKERLLDAAESVVLDGGASRLTLDAVAERAGVSKGGVLYHFPSKDALVTGMVSRLIERAHSRREEALDGGAKTSLAAEVMAALHRNPADLRVSAALLAAVANEPKLLGPARCFHKERVTRLAGEEPTGDFVRCALVLLAVEGLFMLELLQLAPFTTPQRDAIVHALLRMAEEGGMECPPAEERNPE